MTHLIASKCYPRKPIECHCSCCNNSLNSYWTQQKHEKIINLQFFSFVYLPACLPADLLTYKFFFILWYSLNLAMKHMSHWSHSKNLSGYSQVSREHMIQYYKWILHQHEWCTCEVHYSQATYYITCKVHAWLPQTTNYVPH